MFSFKLNQICTSEFVSSERITLCQWVYFWQLIQFNSIENSLCKCLYNLVACYVMHNPQKKLFVEQIATFFNQNFLKSTKSLFHSLTIKPSAVGRTFLTFVSVGFRLLASKLSTPFNNDKCCFSLSISNVYPFGKEKIRNSVHEYFNFTEKYIYIYIYITRFYTIMTNPN